MRIEIEKVSCLEILRPGFASKAAQRFPVEVCMP